jgi:hypothetical protein
MRAINTQQPVPSPRKYKYRNKVEFTFGYQLIPSDKNGPAITTFENETIEASTADGKEIGRDDGAAAAAAAANNEQLESANSNYLRVPAVGFLPQGWAGGVYPPHPLQNIPNWACGIADILNTEFLPTSMMPPYDSRLHRGVWRNVTIRASLRTKECMVIVLHAPAKGGAGARDDGSDDYSHVFEKEKARLVQLLTRSVIPTSKRSLPIEGANDDSEVPMAEGLKGNKCDGDDDDANEVGIRITSIFFQEFEGLSNPSPGHPVQVRGSITLLCS